MEYCNNVRRGSWSVPRRSHGVILAVLRVQPPVRRLQMASGRRFRILAIFDDCTRECLAAVADISLSDRRVARELDLLIARRGRPGTIVSDNRTELTSNAILGWAKQTRVGWHYIAPGKPMQTPSSRASMGVCGTRGGSVKAGKFFCVIGQSGPRVPRLNSHDR
jgi:transposase InsO family protein